MRISDEQRDWLTLAMVPGVGSAHFIRLLARFRTPGAVLRASRGMLAEVVSANLARRIHAYGEEADIDGQEKAMAAANAHLITMEDSAYPERLAEIYDPPLLLFVRGEILPEDERCVAIVGTRRATPYGLRMAERFGRELAAAGITVVSGLAAGVDAAAHRGALEAGGRTIAVLGCGVDVVYPRENETLMRDIIDGGGAVVSQFVMGAKPIKGNFPIRNRIISGLTLGTLIVEAPIRSGALITARNAAEQGREVFAIPGQIGVQNSEGPHSLIRQGAKLVESVDDIIAEFPMTIATAQPTMKRIEESERAPEPAPAPAQAAPKPTPAVANASTEERKVLSALTPDGAFIDEIAERCRLSIAEALRALTVLELKGMVRQFSGKRFAPR